MKGDGLVSEGRGVCSGPLQPRSGEKRAGVGSVPPADGFPSPCPAPTV